MITSSIFAQVDYLELAKLMYKNNNIFKASQNLAKVKLEEVDPEEYYQLLGLVELKSRRFFEAKSAFLKIEKIDNFDKTIYLHLAQAEFGLNDLNSSLETLEKGRGFVENSPKFYLLKTNIYQKLNNYDLAWKFLHLGLSKFKNNITLKKQKWLLLVDLKLYQQSFVWLTDNKKSWKQLEYLQFAGEYRNRAQHQQALATGEMARLLFPSDNEISMELARVYIQKGKLFAAATIMDQVASRDLSYADKASEIWRQTGNIWRSKYWSSYIEDKEMVLKQKLTLAISGQDYEQVIHLTPLIQRSDLFKSEDVQYALAYAHLMNGKFKNAQNFLKDITRSDLLKKSLVLRKTLESCQQRPDQCL